MGILVLKSVESSLCVCVCVCEVCVSERVSGCVIHLA